MIAQGTKAQSVMPLSADRLSRTADLKALDFKTTADLEPADLLLGQERALGAIEFGTGIEKPGFNLFVVGRPDARVRQTVLSLLKEKAKPLEAPSDWVYVNNFKETHKPVAIELPAGRAETFRAAMKGLVDDLMTALPAVFHSDEYQTRRGAIHENFQKRQAEMFSELSNKAKEQGILIVRTPVGFALAPARDGEVIAPAEFNALPEEQRREIQKKIEVLERELEQIMRKIPQWEKERRDELKALNSETARFAVEQSIEEIKEKFSDLPRVVLHIEAVREDIVENVAAFIAKDEQSETKTDTDMAGGYFDRYVVNVLVSQADRNGAPVVEEPHATLQNLIGRVEHVARQGVLVTNFRLIKGGALHRANGGYLLLDIRSVLTEPFAWAALKRALRRGEIIIEDVGRLIGASTTVTLEPDPIPLKLKVILSGDRLLYFLLAAYDPRVQRTLQGAC